MKSTLTSRRRVLQAGCAALALIPFASYSDRAAAATNATMRASLKYQDKPQDDKSCSSCLQFVPGKSAKDKGGCKLMPGDNEISAHGYCTGWTKK